MAEARIAVLGPGSLLPPIRAWAVPRTWGHLIFRNAEDLRTARKGKQDRNKGLAEIWNAEK